MDWDLKHARAKYANRTFAALQQFRPVIPRANTLKFEKVIVGVVGNRYFDFVNSSYVRAKDLRPKKTNNFQKNWII